MWLVVVMILLFATIYCIEYRSNIERLYYRIKRGIHRKPLVYIAHPLGNYGDFDENIKEVEKILHSCIKCFPEYCFISPVTAYCDMYYKMSYDEGMQTCFDLLSQCDELWVYGEYKNSTGCRKEIRFAKDNGIKVVIRDK